MSCYHPLAGKLSYDLYGNVKYDIVGSYTNELKFEVDSIQTCIPIPCGHCIGCRLDYARSWADRMMIELDHSKSAIFVTLTYDELHFNPIVGYKEYSVSSLEKRDFQLFFKRLRKTFSDKEIRYFCAGEYGTETLRKHGHAVIFGLSLDDFPDRILKARNRWNQEYYSSVFLDNIWKNGFTSISNVSWQTCAYVARYTIKKSGEKSTYYKEMLREYNIQPEFALMSRRPGIGMYWPIEHPDKIGQSRIYIKDQFGATRTVSKVFTPKNILSKLELINPELYDKIKTERATCAQDTEFLEMMGTERSYRDYLSVKERIKESKVEFIKRRDLK